MLEKIIDWILNNEIAFLTLSISSLALIATCVQASAARKNNQQSVRPYINTYYETETTDGQRIFSIKIQNTGLGPALIQDFFIQYQNKEYRDSEIRELLTQIFGSCYIGTFRPHSSFPVGFNQAILSISEKTAARIISELNIQTDLDEYMDEKFELVVKYKSFMNKSYTYSSNIHTWEK